MYEGEFGMKIKPTQDNVVVERIEGEATSKGGIIIPDAAKTKTNRGIVRGVGPGRFYDGKVVVPDVDGGEKVIFSAYAGVEIREDDKDYLLLAWKDILAILE
jgi:chaperonin GroES